MRFNIDIEDIKYIKITYRDLNNAPVTIKAAIKVFDESGILACVMGALEPKPKIPQEVILSLVCPDGLYKTKTILRKTEFSEPYSILSLEPPMALERQQNREYFRIPVKYDCVYSFELNGEAKEYKAKTIDISANGLSISMTEHVIPSNECHFKIMINGVEVNTEARYIRSEKIPEGYRISFTYTQIAPQDRDIISRACIHKQLEQRRRTVS